MDPNPQDSSTGPDAPDKEKMELIRARRLAKLGGSMPAAQGDNTSRNGGFASPIPLPSVPPSSTIDNRRNKINITPAAASSSANASSSAPSPNPASQVGVPPPTAAPKDESSGISRSDRKRTASHIDDPSATPTPPRRTPQASTETDEDYADRVLTHVFRVSVDPHHMTSPRGNFRLTFLANLNQELNDEGKPLKLSLASLDQTIIEACTNWPADKPLMNYLMPCWKRASRTLVPKNANSARLELHEEAKRLCMSNCLFALTMPALYGREPNPDHDTLAPFLLRGIVDEGGICHDFIKEAIKRFDEDEAFPAIFNDAMIKISTDLSRITMADSYNSHVDALTIYTQYPILMANLAKHPCFNMAQSAPNIEKNTILGPFFRLSPLQSDVIRSYFPDPRNIDKGKLRTSQSALQMVLRAHQEHLFQICNAIVRSDSEARGRLLDWFAHIMNSNHKRRALQVDPREVASDGFMLNVTATLDRFCEPFMLNDFSKVDKIDVRYFKRKPRVDISDETKFNADQAAAERYYSEKEEGESNFITEIFFLTLAAHHYGSESLNSNLKNLDREIKYLEKHVRNMEAERSRIANTPHQLRLFEETMKRHTNVLEKSMALKNAIEGALLDERMQSTSLRFNRYVVVWLLRLATGTNYKPGMESETIKLPLTVGEHDAFAYIPEYSLQNIVDNFKFVFRWIPMILPSAVGEEMIALCITFLRSSEYIKNPYLKSSLVSLLFSATWPFLHFNRGVLGDQLIHLKFANEYLLHSLMKFYIECESTGANSAFYDKFNIRYEIFQVIKCVWENQIYREQLIKESKVNRGFFIQFVNMLLNDTTYVLDEAFTKFPKMVNIERELKRTDLEQADREKLEEELQTLGNQATSYMQLANETLKMMKLFTETLQEAFTMPEIVSRLASMLNYNLDTLAGKNAGAELRVSNKEKYHFRPIQLIGDFVDIYLNLSASASFVEAVAADGRSYKPDVLDRVSKILTAKREKEAQELEKWNDLKLRFLAAKELLDQADLDLGDIPPEFEDPIMGDIMKDPVLLPSRHIVDRSTIVQHLLSDAKDPFTRQAMTIDDVIPQTELKERIEQWRAEKIVEAKNKLQESQQRQRDEDEDEDEEQLDGTFSREAMDTSEG